MSTISQNDCEKLVYRTWFCLIFRVPTHFGIIGMTTTHFLFFIDKIFEISQLQFFSKKRIQKIYVFILVKKI